MPQKISGKDVVPEVNGLADVIHLHFGSRALSAASKILVLLGAPLPIYDSIARGQLFGSDAALPYDTYYEGWCAAYSKVRAKYVAAVAVSHPTTTQPHGVVDQDWLAMRAFDQHLLDQADATSGMNAPKWRGPCPCCDEGVHHRARGSRER